MANFRKSFNFRNGVQVDEDNFIVNSVGLVGIGTSVPTEFLDVRGSLKVVGVATVQDAFIGFGTVQRGLEIGITSLGSGIIAAKTGIVTYYGDARYLQGMPTSQWVDTDVGLGYTSIYAAGNVGVGTTDPRFTFQVGGNADVSNFSRGVGISSVGDVKIAGIATITEIYGYGIGVTGLNAANAIATGTLHNDRLPSNINKPTGIVTVSSIVAGGNITASTFTGNLTGDVTGTATTATALSGTPNIVVGVVTATKIVANTIEVPNTGITTVSKLLHVGTGGTALSVLEGGRVGVGTALPTSELQIRKLSGSFVEVISEQGQARISVGQSVGAGKSTGVIRFGYSEGDFELINNNNGGDINYILNGNGTAGTGKFSWQDGSDFSEVMRLDTDGNFTVSGITTLASTGGITTTGGDLYVGSDLYVGGLINGSVTIPSILTSNINATSGISTFNDVQVDSKLIVSIGASVGIGTDDPIEGLDVRTQTGLFLSVGVNTDITYNNAVISADGNAVISGGVGIGTTYFDPSGAAVQAYASLIDINEGHLNIKSDSTVGFDTSDPKGVFDFSNVGAATTRPVMVVPNINNTTITGIAQTPTGALIFNTSTSKFQGYTGTAWVNFH